MYLLLCCPLLCGVLLYLNAKYLLKFPGIGQKASQQIILDLKGKVNGSQLSLITNNNNELVDALLALGYKQADVKKIVPNVSSNLTIEEQMLSASSIVLNNVYPKYWENDKDFTSRFYFLFNIFQEFE